MATNVARLLADLHSEDAVRRLRAVTLAGRLRVREAVPSLLGLTGDQSAKIRGAAALALGGIGALEAIPRLGQILREDPVDHVRCAAAGALRLIGTEGAAHACVVGLTDSCPLVIAASCAAITRQRLREAVPALTTLLNHQEPHVQLWACETLLECSGPSRTIAEVIARWIGTGVEREWDADERHARRISRRYESDAHTIRQMLREASLES